MSEGSASVPRNSDFGTRYLEKPLFMYNGGGIKHMHTLKKSYFQTLGKTNGRKK